MPYSPVKTKTITLLHRGFSQLQIAQALNEEFGFGPNRESEFFGPIGDCAKEIAAFRLEAPELAREAFAQGYSWKQVVDGLEAKGLLNSSELISICVRARREACPEDIVEKHVDDVLEQRRQMLNKVNQQAIDAAHALAAAVEDTNIDPKLRGGIDAFRSMVDRNEEDRHDNENRDGATLVIKDRGRWPRR